MGVWGSWSTAVDWICKSHFLNMPRSSLWSPVEMRTKLAVLVSVGTIVVVADSTFFTLLLNLVKWYWGCGEYVQQSGAWLWTSLLYHIYTISCKTLQSVSLISNHLWPLRPMTHKTVINLNIFNSPYCSLIVYFIKSTCSPGPPN